MKPYFTEAQTCFTEWRLTLFSDAFIGQYLEKKKKCVVVQC